MDWIRILNYGDEVMQKQLNRKVRYRILWETEFPSRQPTAETEIKMIRYLAFKGFGKYITHSSKVAVHV